MDGINGVRLDLLGINVLINGQATKINEQLPGGSVQHNPNWYLQIWFDDLDGLPICCATLASDTNKLHFFTDTDNPLGCNALAHCIMAACNGVNPPLLLDNDNADSIACVATDKCGVDINWQHGQDLYTAQIPMRDTHGLNAMLAACLAHSDYVDKHTNG